MTFRPRQICTVFLFGFSSCGLLSAQDGLQPRISRLPAINYDRVQQEAHWVRQVNHQDHVAAKGGDKVAGTESSQPVDQSPSIHSDAHYANGHYGDHVPYVVGPTPHTGYFFQYDHLFWTVTPPDTTVIGDLPSEGFVTVDGITYFRSNSFDTSFLENHQDDAERFEFGHSDGSLGWFSSIIFGRNSQTATASGVTFVPSDPEGLLRGYVDGNADGFDDDLDGDNIFGRSGEDLGTPQSGAGFVPPFDGVPDSGAPIDTDDLVFWLVTFGDFSVKNTSEMAGGELMRTIRKSPNVEWFYGIRYFNFKDIFSMSGTSEALGNSNMTVLADNRIVGPQVGARWNAAWYKLVANVEGRMLLGYNSQTVSQQGLIGDGLTNAAGQPAALTSTAFTDHLDEDAFSPIFEFRVESILPINRYMAMRLGYTGFVAGGISFASPKITYQVPGFGLTNGFSDEPIYVSAFTWGVEINR